MQEEMRKWAVGERKESLQWSLINFPFHPRNPRTLQSMKTVTTIILRHRLEKWQPPETQSDLSSACNILLAIHHFHSYSFARITSNEPVCFEGWNKFSVQIWYPENQIWHTDNSYLSQKEKAIFFLCWSSFRSEFSNHRQNTGFGDKSIMFLRFRENLGLG